MTGQNFFLELLLITLIICCFVKLHFPIGINAIFMPDTAVEGWAILCITYLKNSVFNSTGMRFSVPKLIPKRNIFFPLCLYFSA